MIEEKSKDSKQKKEFLDILSDGVEALYDKFMKKIDELNKLQQKRYKNEKKQ